MSDVSSPRSDREAMSTRVIDAADIGAMLEIVGRDAFMDLMIDALRQRFESFDASEVQVRERDGFRYEKPDLGLLEWMPTHEVSGPVVIKMVGYHPTNPVQRRLPSVIATSSMWDTTSGHLVALSDATLLTSVRTGAASAVATDAFARSGPVTLGVVGLGAQAITQVHAVSRVRSIERVIGIDTNDEVAATFPERIDFLGLDVDIVGPELWELLQHPAGSDNTNRVTVFDSTGWAVEDDVALRLALRLALQHDLGTDIILESLSSDPYDPYSPLVGT
jgi:ornithine cyclodeaminase/alanine dehydrogenase-like protein (mu-crystallin family)